MPLSGPIPELLLTLVAAATLFAVMFHIGLVIVPGTWRWVWRHPVPLVKGWLCTLVVLPCVALAVVRLVDLPRAADIAVMLMAISPGAPLALRRSLDAGANAAFAPVLQISLAIVAVVAMPLWIAVLDVVYAGHATIAAQDVARQVLVAQLLPLAAGMLARWLWPRRVARVEASVGRLATALLGLLLVMALVDVWRHLVDAGPRVIAAVVIITTLALAFGHVLGGPDATTRTAVAIATAARNAGLALLVATVNRAAPEVVNTVLVYLVFSALTVLPYVLWRRRVAPLVNVS